MITLFFFDLLFLIPLFAIGAICSYTDIKYGKIFNKWIKIGFLWGILFYIFLFLYNFFFLFQTSNIQYLAKVVINALIAFLVGYFLWHFGLWSAGDAKFFALCSFLLPLRFYSNSYLSYFPSFNLLVNLFIPLLLALVLAAFLTGIKEAYIGRKKLKNIRKLNFRDVFSKLKTLGKRLLMMLLSYIFISILFQKIASLKEFVPEGEFLFNPLFLFLSIFVVYGFLSNLEAKRKWVGYLIKGAVLMHCSYLLFFGRAGILKSILKQALIFMVLITLFRQILNFYIEKKEVRRIKIEDIQKGDMISKNEMSLILKELKRKETLKDFGKIEAEGLSRKQVKAIKDLFAEKLDLRIRIYKTFPFAPFMLLSVLISILTNSSLIASLI